jgi:spermidine/putrescine transport system substrate-binding protein
MVHFNKVLHVLILVIFGYIFAFPFNCFAENDNTLVILNWEEYMNPKLVREFEAEFNVKVREIPFESDAQRDELLALTQGKGYDVIMIGDSSLSSKIRGKWLARLDHLKIPNIRHIDQKWFEVIPGDQAKHYIVPFLWGTTGIGYREDMIPEPITSWKQLYKPKEELRGKISITSNFWEVIAYAQLALGYTLNDKNTRHLPEVEQLLLAQKPFVKDYKYVGMTEKSKLVTGEVWMTFGYNGDMLYLRKYEPKIKFIVPKEGTRLWCDYLGVSKSSSKKDLAMAFINFVNEPKRAARMATYLKYATPNKAAEKLLPESHLKNPLIYPDKEVISRSEILQRPSPRVAKKWSELFFRVSQ